MILLTYSTTGYNNMVDKYLLPSATDFQVVRVEQHYPVANWDTEMFKLMCREKVKAIAEMVKQLADGEVFVYSDGDVELFGLTPEMVLRDLGDADIGAHSETPSGDLFCAGFLFFRCSSIVRRFCSEWVRLTEENHSEDDQPWFNFLLRDKGTCRILPREKYWNIGQAGLYYVGNQNQLEHIKSLVPATIIMFHANYTIGLQHKTELLEAVRGRRFKQAQSQINMKLPLHYVVNETMRPLAEKYFLPSIPSGFRAVEHKVSIHTSGNFMEDNFNKVMEERTRLIIDEIKRNPNDGLMLWCDTDIIFFEDCAKEMVHITEGSDLLFQRENTWNDEVNFGVQFVRRNAKTLNYYTRLLQMQQSSVDGNDQVCGNQLLHSLDDLTWGHLPLYYSAESNGGCKSDSVLYHANCTGGNSLKKKCGQLKAACVIKQLNVEDKQLSLRSNGNDVQSPYPPIYALSDCGLANRILGLASTTEICRILKRPIVLIWEKNSHIGHVHFNDIFENDIAIVNNRPSAIPYVYGYLPGEYSASNFPNNRSTVLECNDILNYADINESTIRPHLQKLRLVSTLQRQIDDFAKDHDFDNVIGVHIRRGDKLGETRSMKTLSRVEVQYDRIIDHILKASNASIYISCDELAVISKYKELYGDRVLSINKQEDPLNRNSRSLPEAVLDLYLLSKTKYVLYGVGTFGYAARIINGQQGCNILNQENKLLICFKEIEDKPLPDPNEIVSSVIAVWIKNDRKANLTKSNMPMKLELHFVFNETMQTLVDRYFSPSIPLGFQARPHKINIKTSGNYLEDNFRLLLEARTRLIIDEIEHNLDDELMFWCDVDVVFFADCADELKCLAEGNDLLFQRENNWNGDANFGLQIIRRNKKSLTFYRSLLQMQMSSEDGVVQILGTGLLHSNGGVVWKHLPFNYSSESNGGCNYSSVLYHANCTAGNSLMKKQAQLETAPIKMEQSFEGFKCKKEGVLTVKYFRGYGTRNDSTVRLIELAIEKYNIQDFDWIYVYTGDLEAPLRFLGRKVFCYATRTDIYDNVCPDFTFNHWRDTQMDDYEATREEISEAGSKPSETDMLGWRGNVATHPSRNSIIKLDDKNNFDVEAIIWNNSDPNRLTCSHFVSLVDHVKRWRYLLDVEGVGWSARLKLFFFSKRVIFLQERPFKEWYFPLLKAWEHYVPVRRDLSDLVEKLNIIKGDIHLENKIRNNAHTFAQKHLTREAALMRWKHLLT